MMEPDDTDDAENFGKLQTKAPPAAETKKTDNAGGLELDQSRARPRGAWT
jgi:hypothetical protein